LRTRRNKLEIIATILDICDNGSTKTGIVYQANLNFKTVDPYLNLLVKNDLVKKDLKSPKLYKTTNKGNRLRAHINELHVAINDMINFKIAPNTELVG
jgi:predicted transcriptional regulator